MDNKVSIIITTYKGSKEIENAVLSAINQTYKNIEIIVVDDNGKGTEQQISTANKLNYYINKNIIKYIIHENNINGSAARNTGAKASTGEWLTFLDDDDLYLSEKVDKELKKALDNKADMVVCGGYYVSKNGYGYITRFNNKRNLLLDYLTEKTLFNSSSIFINKKVYFEVEGFDESFKRHQDWEFCTRLIKKNKVVILDESLYIKYAFGRNVAQNPEIAEKYLEHFLNKIKDIVDYDVYNKIFDYQVMRVAKGYLRKSDRKNFIRLMKKTSYKLYYVEVFKSNIKHYAKKLFRGSKKRCLSYDESVKAMSHLRREIFE